MSDDGAIRTVSKTDLINSVGVNIHETYNDTVYSLNDNPGATLSALISLGVKWVRIGLKKSPPPYEGTFLENLHKVGIRVVAITGGPMADGAGGFGLGESKQLIAALNGSVYKNRVAMLEMPNEQDIFGPPDWSSGLRAYVHEYYSTLKANPSTRKIPVLGPSLAFSANYGEVEALRNSSDILNVHAYAGGGPPEMDFLSIIRSRATRSMPAATNQTIVSEFGYSTDPRDPHGVSEQLAATYMMRSYLWNLLSGVKRSFAYELFDEKPDPGFVDTQQHYGLYRVSGDTADSRTWRQSAKPSAIQLKSLLTRVALLPDSTDEVLLSAQLSPGACALRIDTGSSSNALVLWKCSPSGSRISASATLQLSRSSSASLYSLSGSEPENIRPRAGTFILTAKDEPVLAFFK